MSAVEALAEVLATGKHGLPFDELSDWWKAYHTSEAEDIVASIRSWSAEQVAELIGGKVETAVVKFRAGAKGRYEPTGARAVRAVTPWLPLGVSPETNGEQK